MGDIVKGSEPLNSGCKLCELDAGYKASQAIEVDQEFIFLMRDAQGLFPCVQVFKKRYERFKKNAPQ